MPTELARARALEDGGRLAAYDEALALWRGPAWAGLAVDVAQGEALRLEEAHVAAREERAEVLLALGRAREAADELRQLVAEQPLRDRPSLLLMRALHRLGASADALAVYAVHRRALAEELGLDPSPELDEAQRNILERIPDPAPSSGATDVTTRDLTGDTTVDDRAPKGTLPDLEPTSRLIGRADDIEQVRALTARHRCVTVIGPGGVGKTSLARAVATTEQSAWWVDLTSVSTEAGVRALVATALGVEVFPGGTAEAALHRRLETATGLLVLDNCEHVLAAVGDVTTEIAAAAAGIRVLATSRERLGLPVEQVYPLAPLRLPGAGVADVDVPSVALFLERASASAPDLEATPDVVRDVGELVRRLDGLPLAIELAASRVGVVSLATLRDRLDERLDLLRSHHRRGPARHQTLVDTIDWSYDLLDEDHRRALRRLAVFVGPFDLDAAEAVLGPDSTEQVLGLVERSLLVRPGATQGGYRMLETVRAYARARLDDAEREEAGLAHARWAADAAASARVGMSGPDAGWWIERIEALLPEFARVVSWALETGRVEEATRIVPDLYFWADFRVRADVMGWGRRLMESGHARAVTPAVLAVASSYWWMVGDHDRAAEYSDRGIELAGGPEAPAAYLALSAAADTALAVGDLDKAWHAAEHAMRLAMDAGDWNATVFCVSGNAPRAHLRRAFGHRRDRAAAGAREPRGQPDDPGLGAVRRGRGALRRRAARCASAVRGGQGAGPYDGQPAGARGGDGRRDGPARAGGSPGRRDREQDRRRRALLAGLGQREPLRHLSAQRGLAPRPARRPPSGRRAGGDDDHPDARPTAVRCRGRTSGRGHGPGSRGAGTSGLRRSVARRLRPRPGRRGTRGRRLAEHAAAGARTAPEPAEVPG